MDIFTEKGLWLSQADAIVYTGKSQGRFLHSVKPKLLSKTNPANPKRKLYFLPLTQMDKFHRDNLTETPDVPYPDKPQDELEVEAILGNITADDDVGGDLSKELQEAKKQEILTRTEYLNQKILDRKHEIFSEWSERFFDIFSKSFSKFKNSLVELHLQDDQISKLNENLDLALKNLEDCLDEIEDEYINNSEDDDIK